MGSGLSGGASADISRRDRSEISSGRIWRCGNRTSERKIFRPDIHRHIGRLQGPSVNSARWPSKFNLNGRIPIELLTEYRIRLIADVVTGQVDVRGAVGR